MRILDLLSVDSIELNGVASSKTEVLHACVSLMEKRGNIRDIEDYRQSVFAREEEGTTGVGGGIAIPHGRCDGITAPGLAAMVIKDGVDYEALDDEPVQLLFLIAAPNSKDNIHLDVLSRLSMLLMDEDLVHNLIHATSKEEFLSIIDQAESAREAEDQAKEAASSNPSATVTSQYTARILAVTACPTGIAHTYMAAESIEKAAKARNCFVKVETRGSGGAKHVLTSEEIASADCIIVAADTEVPMDRFHGKKVIKCPVASGIHKADLLVNRAIHGEANVYDSGNATQSSSYDEKESAGRKIYKQLMNGVSHMLPFVVGGGILIALSFLIDSMLVDMSTVVPEVAANFGSITPQASWFMTLGGLAFSFMLPVLAGYIAYSIADRPGLVVGFVGGAFAAQGHSGFLGALVAGFLAGYIIVFLKKILAKLPKALEGTKPVLLYPLLGLVLIGLGMVFVVEPVMGGINTAMNNGLNSLVGAGGILLGIILAGMMAVDMGGPINKAAYVFGIAALNADPANFHIMAAVMIGGMVPPCAIALSTLLFKKKYTLEERKSGPTNFVMGLSFITEGAIPFAAADPLRVIPSLVVASAIAGGLSAMFGCTLMAPHGGIFVFPVVGNPLSYLLSLVVGTVVGAVILGFVKRDVVEA